jgi:hypothetical protein
MVSSSTRTAELFLVGFYIKFVKAKAIFTVPWSAKSPFSLYTTMPFCFPCRRSKAGLFMAKLHRGNAYDSVLHTSTVCFQKRKG